MNIKQTLILFVLAAGLVAAAMYFKKSEEDVVASAATPTKIVLSGVTSATVERIEIAPPHNETSVTLTKRDGAWYTDSKNGFKADKNLITGLFAAVEKEISGDVVSENAENFEQYQVDDTTGTHVQFFGQNGKSIADLYIGKDGPAAFTTYVREAGGKQVIEARASLSYVFKKPEGWRDRQIFDIKSDAITAISGDGTSGTFELVKTNDTWKQIKPSQRDAQMNKVTPILSMVTSLRASEFVDRGSTVPLSDFGLDPPSQKFVVTHEDRSTSPAKSVVSTLVIGKKKPGTANYYVKRADSDTVYTVSEYIANTLSPNPADLGVEVPPAPAAAETTGTINATSQTVTISSPTMEKVTTTTVAVDKKTT